MWLINVVLVITFLYFVYKILKSKNNENKIFTYVLVGIASLLEVVLVISNIAKKELNGFIQLLILVFTYILPISVSSFRDTNTSFRLKILYAVARLSYSLKKYEFTEGLLERAIKFKKEDSDIYFLRAKALIKLERKKEARDMLFKVIEVDELKRTAYIMLVNLLEEEDKKDTAIIILSKFLKIFESDEEGLELLGILLFEVGREKEALSIYEDLSKEDKGGFNTYYNLGIIYSQNGETLKAKEAYSKAISKNPKLYEAYYAMSRIDFASENYEECIEEAKTALKDSYLKARAYYTMSMAYIKLEKETKAVECLENAVKLDKELLYKAKENSLFEAISLDVQRLLDEREELAVYTYDENEEALDKSESEEEEKVMV